MTFNCIFLSNFQWASYFWLAHTLKLMSKKSPVIIFKPKRDMTMWNLDLLFDPYLHFTNHVSYLKVTCYNDFMQLFPNQNSLLNSFVVIYKYILSLIILNLFVFIWKYLWTGLAWIWFFLYSADINIWMTQPGWNWTNSEMFISCISCSSPL